MVRKSRNFSFTHNNYNDDDIKHYLNHPLLKYVVIGEEVGESGTPHLQGTMVYRDTKELSVVIKHHPGAHIEATISLSASIDYCKKDGKYHERGVPPVDQVEKGRVGGEKESVRWREIREAAEDGRLEDIPEKIRFLHLPLIERHRRNKLLRMSYPDTEQKHQWYYGAAGTGKSRKARSDYPDAYLKMCNKWWDGYDEEQVVIIEDFDVKHEQLCHHLKIWADRYQFIGEFKNGARKLRPGLIIVTSNYHPSEIWTSKSDLEPILRRFHVTHFN